MVAGIASGILAVGCGARVVNQPDLQFTTPPRTHAGDPASSHHAEARLRKSGAMSLQQRVVLQWVEVDPGLMATQLANCVNWLWGKHRFSENDYKRVCQVRKRLSDLKGMGRVRSRFTPGESESRWFSAGE